MNNIIPVETDNDKFNKSIICKKCFNIKSVQIASKVKIYCPTYLFNINKKFFSADIEHEISINNIRCLCDTCNEVTEHFTADNRIAPSVATLNYMGYSTVSSSGGSYELDEEGYVCDVVSPYIKFRNPVPIKLKDSMPSNWEIYKDEFGKDETIITSKELYVFSKCKKLLSRDADEFLNSARYSLFKWVDKL